MEKTTPVYLFLAAFIVITLGIVTLQQSASSIKQTDLYSNSSSQSLIYTSPTTLTSEEGISSATIKTPNQTWLEFDGVNDYVSYTGSATNFINNDFSISFWFKTDYNHTSASGTIFFNRGIFSQIEQNTGKLKFGFSDGSNSFDLISNSKVSDGNWNHAVVVGDRINNNATIYLNGILQNDFKNFTTYSLGNLATQTTYYIGSQTTAGLRSFNGSINDLRFFQRALTEDEIISLNNSGDVNFTFKGLSGTETFVKIITPPTGIKFREPGNVLYVDGVYHTFVTGYEGSYVGGDEYVYHHTSTDGDTWTTPTLLIERPSEDPYAVWNGTNYFIYFEDKEPIPFRNISLRIYNNDFSNYTQHIGVVYNGFSGTARDNQDVSSPVVWIEGNEWLMLYEGRGTTSGEIFLANSSNGIDWNFIQLWRTAPADGSQWDSHFVPDDLIKFDNIYYLTYHGYNVNSGWQLGYLTFTDVKDNSTIQTYYKNPVTNLEMIYNTSSTNWFALKTDTGGTFRARLIFSETRTYNFNENSGTTAYDSSGNNNHGTISGATWTTDGVLNTLTEGVDYTLNKATGVLVLSADYVYNWIEGSWSYNYKSIQRNTLVAEIILTFIALSILAFIIVIINYYKNQIGG